MFQRNLTFSNDETNGWFDLAGAICEAAAHDLMIAFIKTRKYAHKPRSAEYRYWQQLKIDCVLFFRSSYYATLCDVPGEFVISKIREESRFRKC